MRLSGCGVVSLIMKKGNVGWFPSIRFDRLAATIEDPRVNPTRGAPKIGLPTQSGPGVIFLIMKKGKHGLVSIDPV